MSHPTFAFSDSPEIKTPASQFKVVRIGEPAPPMDVDQPHLSQAYWFSRIATSEWFDADKEHLVVITLNTRLRATGFNLISIGGLSETIAGPREIMRPVIVAAAAAFVLMHNHPSGDPTPSSADQRLTQRIRECASLFCITFVDHVIVGRTATDPRHSFRETGLL